MAHSSHENLTIIDIACGKLPAEPTGMCPDIPLAIFQILLQTPPRSSNRYEYASTASFHVVFLQQSRSKY